MRRLIHTIANKILPDPIIAYLSARGTLRRRRKEVLIEHEMKFVPSVIRRGDWVIDVGANIGEWTCLFSQLVGNDGRVFSFEPLPRNYIKLAGVVKYGRLTNVKIYPFAVGDRNALVSLITPNIQGQKAPNSTYVSNEDAGGLDCPEGIRMVALDDIFSGVASSRVNFIKCDIEGMELKMLKGADFVITRDKPFLQLEVSDLTLRYGYTGRELIAYLEKLGYFVFHYEMPQQRMVKGWNRGSFDESKSHNLFFVHSSRMSEVFH